ncbi:MAG: homoserine O-succinyltransferase [Planctomycetes bacterium]|jgi:homoserine O-acetyltransferase|nr:homoserine O-succinyltransferase [Planctomycetota bacterium]
MSATVTLPPGAALCHLPAGFRLVRGGELAGAALAYERQGPVDAPTVVVLGGISAGRHTSAHAQVPGRGWWDGIVGPGAAIDTERYSVLSFDWLGGAGSSTAPAAGEAFPFVDAADQAAALWHLCDALRIPRLHAVIGSSYGGMVAMHAAAQAPSRVARLCCLGASHRSHPQASAFRAVQRGIVELGLRSGTAGESLALARALALATYRTPGELHERFAGAATVGSDGSVRLPVQDWLDARGADFAAHWTAEQFLCLNRSIDAHRIEPAQIAVPTWLLAFVGDQLVPPSEVRELALALPQLRAHRELRSRYGHDAFLKELLHVGAFLREVLS